MKIRNIILNFGNFSDYQKCAKNCHEIYSHGRFSNIILRSKNGSFCYLVPVLTKQLNYDLYAERENGPAERSVIAGEKFWWFLKGALIAST